MRILLLVFSLFGCLIIQAQSVTEDSVTAESAFKWVERKLTFNYYDPTNQNWWVNRLHKNDDGSVTLINIAAEHPEKVLEKMYHLRRFFLYDINPNATTVVEIPKDQGRFVKGRIVRLQGFGDENKIATKKDGIVGSNVSFIHISVPAFLEDSLQNYAFELKDRIQQLLTLDARLVKSGDEKKDRLAILNAWKGNYVNEDSTQHIFMEVVDPGHIRYEWKTQDAHWYGQFGFDSTAKTFFFFRSSADKALFQEYIIDPESKELLLTSETDQIHVMGRNTISFFIGGKRNVFTRY